MHYSNTRGTCDNGQYSTLATPIHVQRIEKALQIGPLISYIENLRAQNLKLDKKETGISSKSNEGCSPSDDRKRSKLNLFNFSNIDASKEWIKEILLSDTSGEDDDDNNNSFSSSSAYIKQLLKEHSYHKKYQERFKKHSLHTRRRYMQQSSNVLSHGQLDPHLLDGNNTKVLNERKDKIKPNDKTMNKYSQQFDSIKQEMLSDDELMLPLRININNKTQHQVNNNQQQHTFNNKNNILTNCDDNGINNNNTLNSINTNNNNKLKFKKPCSNEVMAAKRKKIWMLIAKKEIPRCQKHKAIIRKDNLTQLKKMAKECQKECRKVALASQKLSKDAATRAKRLAKEMLAYWKRFEKVEKEHRKKAEKEALEQKRVDMEMREMKRQQRKLNFLITQTELYAHFMARKLSNDDNNDNHNDINIVDHSESEVNKIKTNAGDKHFEDILKSFDEDDLSSKVIPINGGYVRRSTDDDYDSELMKNIALNNVRTAIDIQLSKKKEFDDGFKNKTDFHNSHDGAYSNPSSLNNEWNQPEIFKGHLKSYQLKGMNWLANLYDQGINGILADEMGLGKTVQSIAFLAHLAENQGIWGPFLIIAPASTLHNWQQEVTRFVPEFKVIPYWGSTQDRKVLRKFWSGCNNRKHPNYINCKESAFHAVITSYQLVVQDTKYFQQINWHYMILDEAQAIKSSNSSRWKSLLVFKCRNRLLLTGTPIQNSMAELWSLLHFIMPTLFDSHDEFNEWFSKDIESHVEKQSSLDTNQLSRLHMILKPFMLRRVKKDVENELSDKIEMKLPCPLTNRQKLLYRAIKNKISIDDLLQSSSSSSLSSSSLSGSLANSLMNIVMQLRKVCNHPELFERREVKSPMFIRTKPYYMPKLMYREAYLDVLSSRKDYLLEKMNIFDCLYVHRSLFANTKDVRVDSSFSFTRFIKMSPGELGCIYRQGLTARWYYYLHVLEEHLILYYRRFICDIHHKPRSPSSSSSSSLFYIDLNLPTSASSLKFSPSLRGLCFTTPINSMYTHCDHVVHFIRETPEHRKLRIKCKIQFNNSSGNNNNNNNSRSVSNDITNNDGNIRRPIFSISEFPGDDDDVVDVISNDDNDSQTSNANNDNITTTTNKRHPYTRHMIGTHIPSFLLFNVHKVLSAGSETWYSIDRSSEYCRNRLLDVSYNQLQYDALLYGSLRLKNEATNKYSFTSAGWYSGGLLGSTPVPHGYSRVSIPSKETLITDAGKLQVLDKLLTELKMNNHRVLIYSQMTRMIDLLEEFLWHRRHTYIRLDGSSKISDRRDMVADFQSREDIFAFLLSTRAGGLGINLTAADTVIFYDSDWNPTVDQQAMDRAHRLGQTKQVTVYRLICEGTIEERILQRALEKSEIQRMVISGGNFAPDVLKPKEVVTLLLDDEDMDGRIAEKQDEWSGMKGGSNASLSSLSTVNNAHRGKTKGRPGRPKKIIPSNENNCKNNSNSKNCNMVDYKNNNHNNSNNKNSCIKNIPSNNTIPTTTTTTTTMTRLVSTTPQNSEDVSLMSASSLVSGPPSPHSEISCTSFDTAQSGSVIEEESCDSMLVVDDNDLQQQQQHYPFPPSINQPKKRGRPKGSIQSRPRGRTSIQRSLCAAELAAVQAAKKATFAAHGYTYTADLPPSSSSKPAVVNNNINNNHNTGNNNINS